MSGPASGFITVNLILMRDSKNKNQVHINFQFIQDNSTHFSNDINKSQTQFQPIPILPYVVKHEL